MANVTAELANARRRYALDERSSSVTNDPRIGREMRLREWSSDAPAAMRRDFGAFPYSLTVGKPYVLKQVPTGRDGRPGPAKYGVYVFEGTVRESVSRDPTLLFMPLERGKGKPLALDRGKFGQTLFAYGVTSRRFGDDGPGKYVWLCKEPGATHARWVDMHRRAKLDALVTRAARHELGVALERRYGPTVLARWLQRTYRPGGAGFAAAKARFEAASARRPTPTHWRS